MEGFIDGRHRWSRHCCIETFIDSLHRHLCSRFIEACMNGCLDSRIDVSIDWCIDVYADDASQ